MWALARVASTAVAPPATATPPAAAALGAQGRGVRLVFFFLDDFESGHIVINVIDMPIKCPVAPLEFAFLADWFFTDRKRRDDVELVYVTPLDGAFTKPVAAKYLGDMLVDRKIKLEGDFFLERVDTDENKLVSYDEREIDYDLLVDWLGWVEPAGTSSALLLAAGFWVGAIALAAWWQRRFERGPAEYVYRAFGG